MSRLAILLEGQSQASTVEPKDVILSVISIAIGALVTWAVTYFYYTKQLSVQRPVWAIRTAPVVRPTIERLGLKVTFKPPGADQPRDIPTASISQIVLWNRGREEIKAEDVGPVHKLAIKVADEASDKVELLTSDVLEQTNDDCLIRLDDEHASSRKREITFEYLGYDDGALIEIVHTGQTSKDIKLTGSFHSTKLEPVRPDRSSTTFDLIGAGFFAALLIGTSISQIVGGSIQLPFPKWFSSLAAALLITGIVAGQTMLSRARRVVVPDKLRKHLFAN